ncbi:MAG TPA: hypothetical protein VMV97_02935 [Sulfuriferula sp.]|nr:hypothetical protein [Sulfuriferula sp.]
MPADFSLPKDAIGRFAVVKLWPEIKTAEDECIARLKLAAQALGVECVEIHADGSLFSAPQVKVSKNNVDFVIHLHYDTPKRYDAFSFVALWNPLKFYHEWGYRRCSRNLTTHDDFISCSSDAADNHVARMVRTTYTHLPKRFHLYHSTADVIHPPSLGEGKLFYAGINWEAISGGKSRHQEVLKRLDKTGLLRIYGPTLFQGVRVWAGYDSYVREIPFDGISMIDEISKAGVALVLSSQAHKDSELMSNRLFESVAAGALVICDENPFAKKFFGDSLLYIDSRSPIEQIFTDITRHLDWAKTHPDLALAMIAKAQGVFSQKFTLIRNLSDLYNGLAERKHALLIRQNPPTSPPVKVRLNLLMPEYSEAVLQAHIDSIRVQEYRNFSPVLVVDTRVAVAFRREIEAALATSPIGIGLIEVDYFSYGLHPEIKCRRRLGEIVQQLLGATAGADAFMIVAPNERLFSNHLAVLAGALQRAHDVHCAATAAVLLDGDVPVHSVHELIDFGHVDPAAPPGFGRFIFRTAAIPQDIDIALPYLDGRPLAVLAGGNPIDQQLPASICIDVQTEFPPRTWDEAAENEVIYDYCPRAFKLATGFGPRPLTGLPVTTTKLQFVRRLLNRHWIKAQIQAIRKQGLPARMQVFKRKLGL